MADEVKQGLNEAQTTLLSTVPADRLTVVQFFGVSEKSSIKYRTAPSPSGALYRDYGLVDYGDYARGDVLYILKEDAPYTRYYKESDAKVTVPKELKATQKTLKAAAKSGIREKRPGEVVIER